MLRPPTTDDPDDSRTHFITQKIQISDIPTWHTICTQILILIILLCVLMPFTCYNKEQARCAVTCIHILTDLVQIYGTMNKSRNLIW